MKRRDVESKNGDPARVLEDALTLTADDRARIAHELIHSLEPEDVEASAAWSKEIRRRVDEIEAGTAELERLGDCSRASRSR